MRSQSDQTISGTEAPEDVGALLPRLRTCTLFEGLAESQLERIVALGRRIQLQRGAFLFREGDDGATIYVVIGGAIRISRQVPGMGEEALAILRTGSAFGEMALIDGSPRSADALAHETAELFVIEGAELENLMFLDRALATAILWKLVRQLSQRLRETNDKMTFLSVTGRFE